MTPQTLLNLINLLVLPGWALLILAPEWAAGRRFMATGALPLFMAVIYMALAFIALPQAGGDIQTVEGLQTAFQNDWVLVLGWAHYLCFDLFIGSWESRDARRLGLPHWVVAPCLVLTLVLGPVGLLAYFITRWTLRRRFRVGEEA